MKLIVWDSIKRTGMLAAVVISVLAWGAWVAISHVRNDWIAAGYNQSPRLFVLYAVGPLVLYGLLFCSMTVIWLGFATKGRAGNVVLIAILLGIAFFFAVNVYDTWIFEATYVEAHCGNHVPCK